MTARYRLVAHRWDDRTGEPVRKYRRGDVLDVPAEHVERLLRIGAIEPVDGSVAPNPAASQQVTGSGSTPAEVGDDPGPAGDSADETPADPVVDDEPADELDEPDDVPADEPEAVPAEGEAKRPPQVADKSVWVAYAVRRGMTEDEAEAMTKRELIAALR